MDIQIDRQSLSKEEMKIDDLVAKIAAGQAILFTGAGFSNLTTNIKTDEPSAAESLAHDICNLGGFSKDSDLRFVTDYFMENNNKTDLVKLLKEKYTLTSTHKIHETICQARWKRFYTTNYDKSIEMSCANIGKYVECIDISEPTTIYYKRDSLCIHLNGSIDSLNEESLENTFKLSTSSYISPDSFIQSDWHYYFKRDLERCSAIVFVGYSMYDIEIQKILYENSLLKDKTYFITRSEPSDKTVFTLSKFGHIVPIGVEGFAGLIEENLDIIEGYDTDYELQSLTLFDLPDSNIDIRDADVESMIMFGHTNADSIADATLSEQRIPYIIKRKSLELVKDFILNNKNIVLYSDMGNGKSIISTQIHAYLTTSSIDCYYVSDLDGDFIEDIDHLSKIGKKIVITLDGYERYLELIKHYSLSLPDNINIVATSRTSEHERLRSTLKSVGFNYNEISLDILSENEIEKLIDIVDNLGMWDDKAGLSIERKIKFIQNKHNSQLSLTLLHLFNAPQIKDRISKELSPLLDNPDIKDTVFSIALCHILDIPCTFSMISDIAGNDKIYSDELRNNNNFKNLFHMNDQRIHAKSSLFCLSLVRNHFSPIFVVTTLQKIARRFNEYGQKDYEQEVIFKSILRFSFVERLLSDKNKKSSLKSYYENLKISVSWLKNSPHFWLQYAMANITFKEYGKAQSFLTQSYSIAQNRGDSYYTSHIDTQQSRLFILIALDENDPYRIYEGFSKAHSILDKLDNDVYKFRQVEMYKEFYNVCYAKLSKKNQVAFQRACQRMKKTIEISERKNEIDLTQQSFIGKTKESLEFILEDISD